MVYPKLSTEGKKEINKKTIALMREKVIMTQWIKTGYNRRDVKMMFTNYSDIGNVEDIKTTSKAPADEW